MMLAALKDPYTKYTDRAGRPTADGVALGCDPQCEVSR